MYCPGALAVLGGHQTIQQKIVIRSFINFYIIMFNIKPDIDKLTYSDCPLIGVIPEALRRVQ